MCNQVLISTVDEIVAKILFVSSGLLCLVIWEIPASTDMCTCKYMLLIFSYVFRECTVDQQGNVCRNTGHMTGKKLSNTEKMNLIRD